jgi:hypothetical protein
MGLLLPLGQACCTSDWCSASSTPGGAGGTSGGPASGSTMAACSTSDPSTEPNCQRVTFPISSLGMKRV